MSTDKPAQPREYAVDSGSPDIRDLREGMPVDSWELHVIEKSAYDAVETQLACVLVNNGKLRTERDELREQVARLEKVETEYLNLLNDGPHLRYAKMLKLTERLERELAEYRENPKVNAEFAKMHGLTDLYQQLTAARAEIERLNAKLREHPFERENRYRKALERIAEWPAKAGTELIKEIAREALEGK